MGKRENQALMRLHVATSGDVVAEQKTKEAIAILRKRKLSEEEAVMLLARCFEESGEDLDEAIRMLD